MENASARIIQRSAAPPRHRPPQETDLVPPGEDQTRPDIRGSRARLVRKVYEVDPLLGPGCGGITKLIAVIECPAVVRQMLDRFGLPTATPSQSAPHGPPAGLAGVERRDWSYKPLG